MVSRLVKEKDLAELVDVDRILRGKGLDFRLVLVGKGPYETALREALPHATFTGYVPLEELTRWYASADIFVFPSTTETFGNVVQESMASGTATVVAGAGGPAGIIDDGVTGLIARPNRPADMAEKVAQLISDLDLRKRLAESGRTAAMTRHWDAINDGLMAEYDALLVRKGRRAG
jgi:glycosyltransferase involved in cell wall biosynthesis